MTRFRSLLVAVAAAVCVVAATVGAASAQPSPPPISVLFFTPALDSTLHVVSTPSGILQTNVLHPTDPCVPPSPIVPPNPIFGNPTCVLVGGGDG